MPILAYAAHVAAVPLFFGESCRRRSSSLLARIPAPEMLRTLAGHGARYTKIDALRREVWQETDRRSREFRHPAQQRMAEPASGAGGMIIAAADVIEKQGFDIGRQLFVIATDVAPMCFKMTYLQVSLRGIPATIRRGNTLSGETFEVARTPAFLSFYLTHREAFDAWQQPAPPVESRPAPERPTIQSTAY